MKPNIDNQIIDPETGEVIHHISSTVAGWPRVVVGIDPIKELELRGKIALKLSTAYGEIEAVAHDDKNLEHKYSFASAEVIYRAVRKGLTKVGLAIIPLMGGYEETPILKPDGTRRGAYLVLDFDFCLIDTETGYTIVIPWRGEVSEYGDKAFNKAATGATKYLLRTLFLLPTDSDEDPDKTGGDRPSRLSAPRSNQPAPVQTAQRQQTAPVDPEALLKRKNIELMKSLALDQDAEGLEEFKVIAKKHNRDAMTLFGFLHARDKTLNTWSKFMLCFDEMLLEEKKVKLDPKADSSASSSAKSSDDDSSATSSEEQKTPSSDDAQTGSIASTPTDGVDSKQANSSSENSSPKLEALVLEVQNSKHVKDLTARAKALDMTLLELLAETASRVAEPKLLHVLDVANLLKQEMGK